MIKTLQRSDTRGVAEHGWLHSHHSFSFASYYNPERMGFGKLRVLNDDIVDPGAGFDTHPHDNMEIISIPLSGALEHKDSMGNTHIIRHGEIQIMSAGTGITHSEYNHSDSEAVNFLQIWILPEVLNITPRYGQKPFVSGERKNRFQIVVSPDAREESIAINQQAYLSLADIDAEKSISYNMQQTANGLYAFVIDGNIEIAGEQLQSKDAIGLSELDVIDITATKAAQLLCIEVPMN